MLVSRIFATNEDAVAAAGELKAAGFRDAVVSVIDKTAAEVTAATLVQKGVSEARAESYAAEVSQGKTLVLVEAPVGAGPTAKTILERSRPGDTGEPVAEYEIAPPKAATRGVATRGATTTTSGTAASITDDPAPLSRKFNWPVLLSDPAPLSKWLNWPVLLSDSAPLSNRLNWPTLSKPPTTKPTSHGLPFLSNDPTPLSSKLGLKVLSDDPAPLSTKLNRAVLSDDPAPLSKRAGWRLLLDNPTPLSSWLNLPVLTGEKPAQK